nr:hypothetical protein CFP56_75300 [Quercus suber]
MKCVASHECTNKTKIEKLEISTCGSSSKRQTSPPVTQQVAHPFRNKNHINSQKHLRIQKLSIFPILLFLS